MFLTEREIKILEKFYYKKKLKLEELSLEYDVSNRMIRYNIDNINAFLKFIDSELVHKSPDGMYELNLKEKHFQLLKSVREKENIDKSKRHILMILNIIFNKNLPRITVEYFKNYFNVSRVTINKDIHEINDSIKLENIKITNTKNGFKISGDKNSVKRFIIDNLIKNMKILNENEDTEFTNNLKETYRRNVNENLQNKMLELSKNLGIEEINFENFYANMLYTQLEYFEYNHLAVDKFKLKESVEYSIINAFLKDIFSEEQIGYLTQHAIFVKSLERNSEYYNNFLNIELIAQNIINRVQESLNCNLSKDKILFEFLVEHINSMIKRIELGYTFEEIEIEAEYKKKDNLYFIIKRALDVLQNIFISPINDYEIYLLKYHFEACFERIKQNSEKVKDVIIITSLGQGTKKIIVDNLMSNFEINILYIGPEHKINRDITTAEYILTTYELDMGKYPDKKFIKISPILKDEEKIELRNLGFKPKKDKILLSNLIRVIEENCVIKDKDKLILELVEEFKNKFTNDLVKKIENKDVLKLNNIIFGYSTDSLYEAIKYSLNLLEGEYIETSYTNEVLKIFENNNNDIIRYDGVILPHTKNNNNVIKSGISIVYLEKPLTFENSNEEISIIVSFVIKDEKNMLDIISNTISKVFRKEFKEVINFRDKELLINYLTEE